MGLRRTISVASILLVASGCGDGSDDNAASRQGLPDGAAATYEGVYQINSWTENGGGCDGAGTDVLEMAMHKQLVLVGSDQLGASILMLLSCANTTDCQNSADAIKQKQSPGGSLFSATFVEQARNDELRGFMASTGYEENGVCTNRSFNDYGLKRSGDSITVEERTKALADKAPEDGFCTVEPTAAQQEAANAPCASKQVVEAVRVAGL